MFDDVGGTHDDNEQHTRMLQVNILMMMMMMMMMMVMMTMMMMMNIMRDVFVTTAPPDGIRCCARVEHAAEGDGLGFVTMTPNVS
jgi:hypothetical protein